MELMKPSFKFKVLGDVFLSPTDLQSLTFLYQPLIGVDAFSLYLQLLNLPNSSQQRHHLLLQTTGGKMAHLIEIRHRLEAAGLLDVYEADELITYILKKPLSVKQFLSDAIMRAFLYVKLGAQDFNILKNMLISENDVITGEKSTKRFDEVFDVRALSRFEANIQFDHQLNRIEKGIELSEMFDAPVLASILMRKGISQDSITMELLNTLNNFAFLYKFDEHELARLVFDATSPDGTVDFANLKYRARTQFQLTSRSENVQVVVKEKQEKVVQPEIEESKKKMIAYVETDPISFLQFKSGGKTPVPADIKLIEWLFNDQGMPAGVINVLIDYVLDYTDENLPKQLVEKITGQWQRLRINTTEAAMEQVEKVLRKNNDYKKEKQAPTAKKKAPVAEAIPEWFGKENEYTKMSEEEAEMAKKRIEEMRRAFLKETR